MKKIRVLTIIIFLLLTSTQLAYAKDFSDETAFSFGRDLDSFCEFRPTDDLTVPKERMTSIDINEAGQILVCYKSKIMVFDETFGPVKAYTTDWNWNKGFRPYTVWNEESGQIVWIKDLAYEIDEQGHVVRYYDGIEEEYKSTSVNCGNVIYKLENRNAVEGETYSYLVRIDAQGHREVLQKGVASNLIATWGLLLLIAIIVGHVILAEIKQRVQEKKDRKKYKSFDTREKISNPFPPVIWLFFLVFLLIILFVSAGRASAESKDTDPRINFGETQCHRTDNLTIPRERITSLSVNGEGETIVCFNSKILVFTKSFGPKEAYEVTGGGLFKTPYAAWKNAEPPANGNTVTGPDGVQYRLEKETSLPGTARYRILIRTDETGKEVILHDSGWMRMLGYLGTEEKIWIAFFLALAIWRAVAEHRQHRRMHGKPGRKKKNRQKMQEE